MSDEALKPYIHVPAWKSILYSGIYKNKYRKRLEVEANLRFELSSNVNPNITDLVANEQLYVLILYM